VKNPCENENQVMLINPYENIRKCASVICMVSPGPLEEPQQYEIIKIEFRKIKNKKIKNKKSQKHRNTYTYTPNKNNKYGWLMYIYTLYYIISKINIYIYRL